MLAAEAATSRYGPPIEQATDPDTDGWWKVAFTVDYAEKAVREALEKASDDEKHAIPRVWLDPDYVPRGSASARHQARDAE